MVKYKYKKLFNLSWNYDGSNRESKFHRRRAKRDMLSEAPQHFRTDDLIQLLTLRQAQYVVYQYFNKFKIFEKNFVQYFLLEKVILSILFIRKKIGRNVHVCSIAPDGILVFILDRD